MCKQSETEFEDRATEIISTEKSIDFLSNYLADLKQEFQSLPDTEENAVKLEDLCDEIGETQRRLGKLIEWRRQL